METENVNFCSKKTPMPVGHDGQWEHEGAEFQGTNYEGDIDYYKCSDCGAEWRVCHS